MMEVMPSDQHLFTPEGRELTDNQATLADMAILPNTMLALKVSSFSSFLGSWYTFTPSWPNATLHPFNAESIWVTFGP